VRSAISSFANLCGKTIAVDGAGTTPYFVLAYMMRENGLSIRNVSTATLAPQPAAQAFVAGQFDGCSTYEPDLSQVRAMGASGKILATTVDHACVVDALPFKPAFIAAKPEAVRRVVKSWYDALAMIVAESDRSFEIMGRRVNQTGEVFKASSQFIEWLDQAKNCEYVGAGLPEFMRKAHMVQRETGVVRADVPLGPLLNTAFIRWEKAGEKNSP
jgi:NitT/TauT family transport system substrate-binding protein